MALRSAGAMFSDSTMIAFAGRCALRMEGSEVVRGLQTMIATSACHTEGVPRILERALDLSPSAEVGVRNSVISTGIGNWVRYPEDICILDGGPGFGLVASLCGVRFKTF